MSDLTRDIEFELAALADGSLDPERREQVLARVRGSRELQSALAQQRRVVELAASSEVRAPASLHRKVEAMAPARRVRMPAWPRLGFAAAGATAVALAAIALAIGVIRSPTHAIHTGSTGLSVQRVATLTLSPARMPAPAESKTHRAQLAAEVGGVPFPYWGERFGWLGSGARIDRVAGRSITTVFYSNTQGSRIGYAIVSGRAPAAHDGTIVWRWEVPYRVLSQGGATVVTWQQGGHMCVVSGREVSVEVLLSLASWDSKKSSRA